MDPFFLPLPLVNLALGDSYGYAQLHQLEQYVDVAVCLLRQNAERLRAALGPEGLESEWSAFLAGNDPLEQSKLLAQFDLLVKQRQESEAVRLFRERLGVTWDQAFDLYVCWWGWDQAKEFRCLQMAELRRLFVAVNGRTQQGLRNGIEKQIPLE